MAKGYGISEQTVGRWLQLSRHRDNIVLATKVHQPLALGSNDRRLSAYDIRRECEARLQRLQAEHIDLYQMHHVDRARRGRRSGRDGAADLRGRAQVRRRQPRGRPGRGLVQSAASARHFLGLS